MKGKNMVTCLALARSAIAGASLLMAAGASAQNLFVSNYSNGTIYEITPGGTESVFASGMSYPVGMAFNSAGDLFVGNSDNNAGETGNVTEITPNGMQTIFVSGIDPQGLAFNSAGDLFEGDYRSGNIYEYTPDGAQSTFATGLSFPLSMAFNRAGDLFDVDTSYNNIIEFTASGAQSTFASLTGVSGLAVNGAGDLFVSNPAAGSIVEISPGGVQSTLASIPNLPDQLAFQPVPEPSDPGLITAGAGALVAWLFIKKGRAPKFIS